MNANDIQYTRRLRKQFYLNNNNAKSRNNKLILKPITTLLFSTKCHQDTVYTYTHTHTRSLTNNLQIIQPIFKPWRRNRIPWMPKKRPDENSERATRSLVFIFFDLETGKSSCKKLFDAEIIRTNWKYAHYSLIR